MNKTKLSEAPESGCVLAPVMFQPLEFKGTPVTRWASSLAINGAALLLLAIPGAVIELNQPPLRVSTVVLTAPPPLSRYEPARHKAAPQPKIIARHIVPMPVEAPQPIKPQPQLFQAPPVKPLEAKTVKLPSEPVELTNPAPVNVAKLEAPKIEVSLPVAFPSTPAPVSPAPLKVVKTGGYGDPNGVTAASTASNRVSMLQRVGAFDLQEGTGHGAGGGSKGNARAIAGGNFADVTGVATGVGAGGNGHGAVRSADFNEYDTKARPVPVARAAAPVQTPVEIIYKPKPAYTPEARAKKIEGAVRLEVLFSSAGQVQVLRLLNGLGYGLDENARRAASQVRFRPSTRNGEPIDVTGTVQIIFEIS